MLNSKEKVIKFKNCILASDNFIKINKKLKSKCFWAMRTEISVNLFLWHLNEFKKNRDPRIQFVKMFNQSTKILADRNRLKNLNYNFNEKSKKKIDFENYIKTLFSEIWLNMTDDIYFDQTYNFTKERFLKSGVDPVVFFKNKIVLDAGCGSGKFSCTIAKFGARKVYGLDLSELAVSFANKQKNKRNYSKKIIYKAASLVKLPIKSKSIDVVFSNGVVHHTSDYEKCIKEFNRILNKEGKLFLYVNGSMGLFEILQDKIRQALSDIPQNFILSYLKSLGINSGRLYWLQDCLNAPYEYKSKKQIIKILNKHNFKVLKQLNRGVKTDQIEQISSGLPYGEIKYGDGQVKLICEKIN